VDRVVGERQFLMIVVTKKCAKKAEPYIYGQRKIVPWNIHALMMATYTAAETRCSKTLQYIQSCCG